MASRWAPGPRGVRSPRSHRERVEVVTPMLRAASPIDRWCRTRNSVAFPERSISLARAISMAWSLSMSLTLPPTCYKSVEWPLPMSCKYGYTGAMASDQARKDRLASHQQASRPMPMVITDHSGPLVALAAGGELPSRFTAVSVDRRTGLSLGLRFLVTDGQAHLVELHVSGDDHGPYITPSQLRELRLGQLVDEVVDGAVVASRALLGLPGITAPSTVAQASSRRGRRVSDEVLRRVAEIVRENGYDPRQQVASELRTSPRTASRWIATAQQRGFITPQKKGNGE